MEAHFTTDNTEALHFTEINSKFTETSRREQDISFVFRAERRSAINTKDCPKKKKKATRVESSIWQEFCFYNQYANTTVIRV